MRSLSIVVDVGCCEFQISRQRSLFVSTSLTLLLLLKNNTTESLYRYMVTYVVS